MKLNVCGISKQFGKQNVLSDINLELHSGLYGLLGKNGAGKTTLIRILIGLEKADAGNIYLNGKDIRKMNLEFVDRLGYLPQYPVFYKDFYVDEFLKYMCDLKNFSPKATNSRVDEVLEIVHLEEERNKKIGQLSGGMRQRLGIGQAILNFPDILILDEPTAGLDPSERIHFRNIISSIARDRIVIFATHIISDVECIADEIILLHKGVVVRQSSVCDMEKWIKQFVWKLKVTEEELEYYTSKYQQCRIEREENHYNLFVAGKKKPEGEFVQTGGTLEDIFLLLEG